MTCQHCGKLCLDPHTVDDDRPVCRRCGYPEDGDTPCRCYRCDTCGVKLSAEEEEDGACRPCLNRETKGGNK